jgi:hypothetical protein
MKHSRLIGIVVGAIVIGGLAWQLLRPHEPLYQGEAVELLGCHTRCCG